MTNIDLDINYTPQQFKVFFGCSERFIVVSKGRRVGLTRGAAQAFVDKALRGKFRYLWGETYYGNVQRYIDGYFMPILKMLPDRLWHWNSRLMQLRINQTLIDFRSSDSPETWEGFGYHLIFLNEAGIILKDPDLYKKTVLPMLMDYPDSQLIAAGVPKGKKLRSGELHPFYKLYEDNPDSRFKFTSYDNSYLDRKDVDALAAEMDEQTRLQEIYGEFIDMTESAYMYAFDEKLHVIPHYEPSPRDPIYLSFDFNYSPNSCVIGQTDNNWLRIFDEISVVGGTELTCDRIYSKYKHWIESGLFFVTGDATGRSRSAVSGELSNYLVIKRKLNVKDYQFKVRTVNLELKSSQVLCNSLLTTRDVKITVNCRQTITDCQLASTDRHGDLIKDTGLHKFDCFRYLLDACYPKYLMKN